MMRNILSYSLFEKVDDVPVGTVRGDYVKTGPNSWQFTEASMKKTKDAAEKEKIRRAEQSKAKPGFWHGTADRSLIGKNGIHVGTYEAAKQALEARIGVPAVGEWDGSREYGKTLLAGKKRLKELGPTGYNCGDDVPNDNYYPNERKKRATYSDRSPVPMDAKPDILSVKIIGRMSNTTFSPHTDAQANGLMRRSLNSGKAKSGFYYTNDGEDSGSISAVVPDKTFLEIL